MGKNLKVMKGNKGEELDFFLVSCIQNYCQKLSFSPVFPTCNHVVFRKDFNFISLESTGEKSSWLPTEPPVVSLFCRGLANIKFLTVDSTGNELLAFHLCGCSGCSILHFI